MALPSVIARRVEDRLSNDVFVVSSNPEVRQELQDKLVLPRWNLVQAESGAAALELLREHAAEDAIMLLDPNLPDLEADEFQGIVKERFPTIQTLIMNSHTGHLLIGSASPTPISIRVAEIVNRAGSVRTSSNIVIARAKFTTAPNARTRLRSMVGDSEPMLRTYALTRMVAARDTTVLVTGESGTGKDLIAQEIHQISPRRNQPFIIVNCSAIPETMLEAELFGYTKGSFTGALQSRIGRVQAAHGGTLFLDEIGDMPATLQSKILRLLEQGEIQRLGSNENLKVDVRVISATNADLKKRIAEQQFREDLYYRLAVFPIHLPPLRDRLDDLEELAITFAAKFLPGISVSREVLVILAQHCWPGNVRELRNTIERATILVGSGDQITPEHIIL
jgi:DNA-binding NtrC family response regulator